MERPVQASALEAKPSPDQRWWGLYLVSAVMFVLAGLASELASRLGSVLYTSGMPSTAMAYLQLVSQKQALANSLWSLWMFLDLLLIAPSIALYLVLRRDGRAMALLGTVLSLFFVFYDISVTELNSLTLVSLSNGYASAATAALKAPYVSAATYGYAALPLETVLSFGIGSLGYLLWSIVMLRGKIVPRWVAILGVVMGVMGIVGAAAPVVTGSAILQICQYLSIPLMGLWFVILGVVLFRYRRHQMLMNQA